MDTKLTKEELFKKAQERFSSWAKMYSNPEVTAQQMYEDMSCSCYSGSQADDFKTDKPVLDQSLSFEYKGYKFELSSCNNITRRNQIVGLTMENIKERFPKGIFSDRYVCWMFGHKDHLGHTKDYVDDPDDWAPNIYLVPEAWSWGADNYLIPGAEVHRLILKGIDKFLETFKE
ncbi:MAG: hypothetical protein UIM53_07290 [Acutalibacteraceae bacterium]|nr:hypothetical protein [Acutalibacteraceae bacterium]